MKNYLKNENIFQIAAIRYQRQLWLCILFGSNQTILYIFLKFKKWRRDEGRQTKSEIVMHKILIILSAGTKLSVVLLNVTTLFFTRILPNSIGVLHFRVQWHGNYLKSQVHSQWAVLGLVACLLHHSPRKCHQHLQTDPWHLHALQQKNDNFKPHIHIYAHTALM